MTVTDTGEVGDDLAATARRGLVELRRRAWAVVVGIGVLLTLLVALAVAGSLRDDAAIAADRAVAVAEVLEGSGPGRTLVRFTGGEGQIVVPATGVFHPQGLTPGQFVTVEYAADEPELVRVAGRSTLDRLGGVAVSYTHLTLPTTERV